MHITTKAAIAGIIVSLSSGAALADWEDAKTRALAYHDPFGNVPLAYDGEMSTSVSLLGVSQACVITYSYAGTGTNVDVTGVQATPQNDEARQICNGLTDTAREMAASGIGLPGAAVREIFDSFAKEGIVPELSNSTRTSETYTAVIEPGDIDTEFPEEMNAAGEIEVSMTFAKSNGRVLGAGFNATASVEETEENPAMSMQFDGDIAIGALDNGQPHFSSIEFEMNAEAHGNGQSVALATSFGSAFTNVRSVPTIASAQAEAQPAAMEAGGAAPASTPLDLLADQFARAARDAIAGVKAQHAKSE